MAEPVAERLAGETACPTWISNAEVVIPRPNGRGWIGIFESMVVSGLEAGPTACAAVLAGETACPTPGIR